MGWLWAAQAKPSPSGEQPQQQVPPAAPPSQEAGSDLDPEVQKFLSLFNNDTASGSRPARSAAPRPPPPAPATQPDSQPTSKPSSSWTSWLSGSSSTSTTSATPSTTSSRTATQPEQPPGPATDAAADPAPDEDAQEAPALSPLAESLLPTDMSCQQAFNQAFHCQSVGGQWTAVYRAGTMRSCSEHWDDFWFCMRVKAYAGKMREDAIRAHYRARELDKYGPGKPSSEDVWPERRDKLPPGTAFTKTYERPAVSDAEWQRAEVERLRRIREGL